MFPDHLAFIALASIGLNILIGIAGVLPSTFITVGTIGILGFEKGLIILIVGEAVGAIVSFILYRKGLYKLQSSFPKINNIENGLLGRLKKMNGQASFFMVILLRIMPFVPSGAVTLTASLSKMGLLPFSIASTMGKIPSLIIEAYSTAYILDLKFELQITLVIIIILFFLLYKLWKGMKETTKR